jgi:hypothetical protein
MEQRLDDAIVTAMDDPRMRGIIMDQMERWRRINGSHYVAGPVWYAPNASCSLPNNCGELKLSTEKLRVSYCLDGIL